mmetsp:Transcript_1490/g.2628  ORF Transcript_1490/g.2628 Transcript_1490/m.2628 type:complete len:93 (+) Transcript_1490:236-514(+)
MPNLAYQQMQYKLGQMSNFNKTSLDQMQGMGGRLNYANQFNSDQSTQFPYIMSDDNRSINTLMMPPAVAQIDSDIQKIEKLIPGTPQQQPFN